MILLDDRFTSIVPGVMEGRLIFEDLKKSIRYTLTHILPEVAAFAAWTIFLIPPPLTPILVLMIDVGSELGPALSFAREPAELNLLQLKPRKKLKPKWDKPVPPTFGRKLGLFFRRLFIAPFALRQSGESLIDGEMIRWVYLQGGVFEAIGAFGAYIITFVIRRVPLGYLWKAAELRFVPGAPSILLTNGTVGSSAFQVRVLKEAQSSYYLAIIIGQLFNLFLTKSRYTYPNPRCLKR